jgi:Zn-dependent protease
LAELLALVTKHFEISDFVASKNRVELEVTARDSKQSFRSLLGAAKRKGYLPMMRGREDELRLMVTKLPKIEKSNVMINILLLAATLGTTFWAGYLFGGESVIYGFLFSGSIMLILGAHELGHKIAAWRHGVAATLPYFIPIPMFLGTFGALIKIKSPIPTREALVEMGMSGPIFGFLVAVPITVIGLMLPRPLAPIPLPFAPLLFGLLQPPIPGVPGIHPLVFAGWVGMLVTMFNLLPAGQLDGGHIARGLMSRERHYRLTRALGFSLLISGFFFPGLPVWIFGFLILLMFRGYHVGALDDVSKLSKHQKWLAAATFAVFLLCIPIPMG